MMIDRIGEFDQMQAHSPSHDWDGTIAEGASHNGDFADSSYSSDDRHRSGSEDGDISDTLEKHDHVPGERTGCGLATPAIQG